MANPRFNNVIRIPCNIDSLFTYWLEFLEPYHHLTAKELTVASAFLRTRYALSKVILDEDILDKTLMSEDYLRKIREECKITNLHYQVIRSKFKSKGFLVNNKIHPRLIPNIKEVKLENGENYFLLLLLFDIKDNVTVDNK